MNKKERIRERVREFVGSSVYEECPPFPKVIMVESTNICNQSCVFCAYKNMRRPHGVISGDVFKKVVQEGYDLGARDIGLHTGAEPLTCNELEYYIEFCNKIGYEYTFITTNGSLATKDRIKRLIDAGLHSLKFSVNAGDRETYKNIHGRDHFDLVCDNILFAEEYRRKINYPLYLAISFVEIENNAKTYDKLYERFKFVVDEIYRTKAFDQSGQMPEYPSKFKNRKKEVESSNAYLAEKFECANELCPRPFNTLHITREGYLRACCNDYDNFLAIEDLTNVSLKEAWISERFRNLRKKIIKGDLKGTLCYNCVNGAQEKILPINKKLATLR